LATDLQKADISGSLSALEKDLESLLQLEGPEATARQGASGYFGTSDLMITSTPERHFVHWEGMKPSDQLEAEDRLVAHLEPLPFQKGRPLATMVEESTKLADESSEELISRHVLMEEEGKDDGDLPIDEFDAVSEDEAKLTPAMKMMPIVRRGGPEIGPAQLAEGGSMSAAIHALRA
jgi:hypothetical protein